MFRPPIVDLVVYGDGEALFFYFFFIRTNNRYFTCNGIVGGAGGRRRCNGRWKMCKQNINHLVENRQQTFFIAGPISVNERDLSMTN